MAIFWVFLWFCEFHVFWFRISVVFLFVWSHWFNNKMPAALALLGGVKLGCGGCVFYVGLHSGEQPQDNKSCLLNGRKLLSLL